MTENKPIMIDGVDVSGCEFHYIEMFAEHYGCNLYPPELNCKYHPNCYFKQLARKTQECEELRTDIKDIANLLDLDTGEEYNFGNIEIAIKGLKQECEIWKNQVLVLDDKAVTVQMTQEQFEEYNNLKVENEELERLVSKQKNAKIQLSKLKDKQYKEFCDMKQILIEIKEIVETENNDIKVLYNRRTYQRMKQILQKLSEVENDN